MMHQLIIGMPNSGKSTFIAALRHLLLANEVTTELKLTGLAENEAHLNLLERDWLACQMVERTKPATEGWVQFHVRDQESGIESTLSIPDLRGEAFEQPACIGKCQKELHDSLIETDGILLFTNADREDDALLISDFSDILGEDETADQQPLHGFKPENMPEEVKIVEFLQFANRRPRYPRKRKVAVLISAWDIVENQHVLLPDKWLETHRPMLAQFLETNYDLWETRVYGISAQGGKLPEMQVTLEKIKKPSERIRVVGNCAKIHDLSAPLRWLMLEHR
ncbi:MAG: hypothetical protein Q7T36_04985 [Fluviicoccus sp.]|uniref:TRAFAC clade GTPase domain-containing protein n=1 Tax=Fluviicoccus sp. TaxID=2003552 RepID=UPI002725F672|nr:hypothetical protein [Fluviicoccus sp.]MDO8329808.1 hypothetical protein [Fluviicoccus sp.]